MEKYLEKLKSIEDTSAELGVLSPISATLDISIKNKDKDITYENSSPVQSFTRNGLNLFALNLFCAKTNEFGSTFGSGQLVLKAVIGTVIAQNYNSGVFGPSMAGGVYIANVGDSLKGIQVGTGTQAESLDDYCLKTKIDNGTGSGQLLYGACTNIPTWDSGSRQFTTSISRQFSNLSGGTITVNEYGLVGYIYTHNHLSSDVYNYIMTVRDVLGSGVVVEDESTLTVIYKIKSPVYPS